MPSPSKRVCIIGDSHIGCLKLAFTQKAFKAPKAVDFEFWGADGPRFRELDYVDGQMIARPDVVKTVLAVNGQGREIIDPKDFDAVLFMGARVRSLGLFEPMLDGLKQEKGFLSEAVFNRNCQEWLIKNSYYKIAKDMAARSACQIFLAPATFPTEGWSSTDFPNATKPNKAGVNKIWKLLETRALEDDVTLLRQPPDTCGAGCTSSPEYSRQNLDGTLDVPHRNAAYGALILKQLVACLD